MKTHQKWPKIGKKGRKTIVPTIHEKMKFLREGGKLKFPKKFRGGI